MWRINDPTRNNRINTEPNQHARFHSNSVFYITKHNTNFHVHPKQKKVFLQWIEIKQLPLVFAKINYSGQRDKIVLGVLGADRDEIKSVQSFTVWRARTSWRAGWLGKPCSRGTGLSTASHGLCGLVACRLPRSRRRAGATTLQQQLIGASALALPAAAAAFAGSGY